ncbi:MAG TPA: hypothetical protein VI547_06400 [Anaerolineales bacterium]|nr:hypothetical protein [Anaerolineales bacterium]
MTLTLDRPAISTPVHDWLKQTHVAFVPGEAATALEPALSGLADTFRRLGHTVQPAPDANTGMIITTSPFGDPVSWRQGLMFTGRKRFGLTHTPTVFTVMRVAPRQLQSLLDHFERVLPKEPPDPGDYNFPGLAPEAYLTLVEQGRRGGPMLALLRLLQAQSKSIRILLLVGDDEPQSAHLFDLVGAYPRIDASDPEFFFADIALRMVTAVSTFEITKHQVVGDLIPRAVWDDLDSPNVMLNTSHELGQRRFFTEMIRVNKLVHVPALSDSLADQYSEGCFATWDPGIPGLVATITGSARPVDKTNITEDDLAIIVGVRPDRLGAQVRHVEGKRNDKPSSEAVEMMDMDEMLPQIALGPAWGRYAGQRVPVSRSKLHGHRSIAAFDPRFVEFVPLDPPFYYYPVSCATEAQARGIKAAFARSQALQNPADPRQVAFTILPGHGIVVVEKWVPGKAPFQVMWEFMDAGYLVVENRVPQGPHNFVPDGSSRHILSET